MPSYVLMPATKQPNMRPQKRNVDLRKGLPKNWRKTLMKITLNARPTYSGLPNGSMTLPFSLQSCGPPNAAERPRSFSAQNTPPPTYLMPAVMSDAPMSMTETPVTTGGNNFWRIFDGMSAMTTSTKAATMAVPRNLP